MATADCGFGHIYDSDIYPTCPYCNNRQPVIHFGQTPVGAGGRTMGPVESYPPIQDPGATQPLAGGWGPQPETDTAWGGTPVTEGGKTAPIGYQGGNSRPVTDDSVTRPPRGYERDERRVDEEQKTVGELRRKLGIDPVVGWLVCIKGTEKGKDYRIMGRVNTIGSSERMDICIKGEKTISKVNHARLGYGEKTNRFTLIPADGANVIYLNGEEVYSPTELSPYDLIEFGETALVFIPFCSSRFTWEKGLSGIEGGT